MLFRMLFRQLSPTGLTRPLRQLFVTQSHVLAKRVHEYYKELVRTYEIRQKSSGELSALIENGNNNAESNLLVHDDVDDERKDLPSRFSLLTENHFPLFLNFDQVSSFAHPKYIVPWS